jgi:hypothetical protein
LYRTARRQDAMTYRLVTQRARIARAALAVALLALTGVSAWVGVSRATSGQGGAPALLIAGLLPLATAGLLFVRPRLGAGLAVVAALVGAVSGIALSFCLCAAPLSDSSIALLVASGAVLAVGIVTLLMLGMTWVVIGIPLVPLVILFSGNPFVLLAGVVVVGAVTWLVLRRRRAAAEASTS